MKWQYLLQRRNSLKINVMPNILNKHGPHLRITTLNKLPCKQEVSSKRIHVWCSFDFNLLLGTISHKSFSITAASIFRLSEYYTRIH